MSFNKIENFDDHNATNNQTLLTNCLLLSVPIAIQNYQNNPRLLQQDSTENLSQFVNVIANHGDEILYKSSKSGNTAKGFEVLSKAIALLSFRPGGVTFMGLHFDAHEIEQKGD